MTETATRSAAHRGTTAVEGDDRARSVDRWVVRAVPALALAALLPVGAVTPLFPVELGVAVFALGTLAVGMVHGAVDHLIPMRAAPNVSVRRSIAVVSVAYAVLGGGAVVAAFFVAPVAAFIGFIALTWLHWGQGTWPRSGSRASSTFRPRRSAG